MKQINIKLCIKKVVCQICLFYILKIYIYIYIYIYTDCIILLFNEFHILTDYY